MTLKVLTFAAARQVVGADSVTVELVAPATVADVRAALSRDWPALGRLLNACRIALDGEFAHDDQSVGPGSEVAIVPPVSGG